MKVFVAGATGVIGRALAPQLVARGHEVIGMTRSASKQDLVRSLGARPVVADALDPNAVAQAVASAEPEVIVHQLTALSGPMSVRDMRHPDRSVAATMTNRLRTEATDHLLAAGHAVGTRRFVAQSFAAFRFARTGGPVLTEADPLDPDLPAPGLAAILHLEQAVTTIEWGEGLVLRYGGFYGPGTGISLAADAVMAAPIRKRRFPIVGDGGGVWSHRRRRGGDRGRGRARPAGHLQHCRRRPRARAGVAAGAGERAWCQATEACPTLARAVGGR
jgi:nucleoside-diphosphate-sugar epimerase